MAKKVAGAAEVRAWAKENGVEVGARGRFSAETVKAFEAATGRKYAVGVRETVEVTAIREVERDGKTRKVPVKRKVDVREARSWAVANGQPVGSRGKIPTAVLQAFVLAQ